VVKPQVTPKTAFSDFDRTEYNTKDEYHEKRLYSLFTYIIATIIYNYMINYK